MPDNATAIAVREQPTGGALAMWDAEQIEIIKRLICPDATDTELALFGQVCQRTGLDPFAKQIYGIKRKGRLTIQTGIDGFRLQAQRSRDYAGQEGPQWAGEDGVWRDVWLSKEPPSASRVGVYRKGWTRPVWGVATWSEYAQYGREGLTEMWKNMPSNQLAKCAEAQALRKAFPAELSGLYAKEEMDQADNDAAPDAPARPAIVAGEVISPAGWTQAAEQRWQSGVAKAGEVGATVPEKPAEDAPRDVVLAALQELAANIKGRRELIEALTEVAGVANEAGGAFAVPENLAGLSDEQLREMTSAIQETIAVAEVA
jgi:phage recombination protein Bet